MERKIFFGILVATLVALALAILMPGGRQADSDPKLPWQIRIDETGHPTVLGITLGRTTLKQARDLFQEQGELNLFVTPPDHYAIEAYFQRLFLSGLRADVILTLAVDPLVRKAMYERGLRISKLGSGDRKVDLTVEDKKLLEEVPVDHITYIPAIDLDEVLITARFGEPTLRIAESPEVSHWLYPAKGLDIAVNRNGKEVIQYVIPAKFDQILGPLQEKAARKGGETGTGG
ncbi:MAG TPA: hypothetical protein ENK50_06145 [Sedimenticola sp.]|nr:hypothetical protein [Sedimenticola sp.]